MAQGEFHTRFVGWMKIILPVIALGLLSTLFLLSRTVDPTQDIPVTEVDLEQRAQDQGASNPSFSGVTEGGEQVTFEAAMVRPDLSADGQLLADRPNAKITLDGGTVVTVTAANGRTSRNMMSAELLGEVVVTTSQGYQLNSKRIVAEFEPLTVESPGPVTGKGPPGDLEAGRMHLTSSEEEGRTHLLFTGGVKLVYKPRGNEE